MHERLRLRGIAELPIGTDEVVGEILRNERERFGVTIADVACATGADELEITALEQGAVNAFADHERMRNVILAYCDYLEIDPTPLLGRLESYGRWQTIASPNLYATAAGMAQPGSGARRWTAALLAVAAAGVAAWMAMAFRW